MTSSASISVATSLVPHRDHEIQSAAVSSWQSLGFSVVSLNAASEIDDIRRQFPAAHVMQASRTAERTAGKPLPLIKDLLLAAQVNDSKAAVVGIINSDIVLRSGTDIAGALKREAANATVMLPRVDVSNLSASATFSPTGDEKFSIGYDGAFLAPNAIGSIPESLFCIGMPFWDYWLPLMMVLQGYGLKAVASPVALHVNHPTRWDKSIYLFFHAMVGDMIAVCAGQARTSATPAFEIMLDVLKHTYNDIFERATKTGGADNNASAETLAAFYDRIQEVAVHHIKTKAQAVTIPEIVQAQS